MQASVSNLSIPEDTLDNKKTILNLAANAGLLILQITTPEYAGAGLPFIFAIRLPRVDPPVNL